MEFVDNLDSPLSAPRHSTVGTRIVVDDMNDEIGDIGEKRIRGASGKMAIKFLISNNSAGFLIGKGGSAIVELQASTKARVNIAQSSEFFPGTFERAVLIAGTLSQIISCQAMIWKKMAPSLKLEDAEGIEYDENETVIQGKLLIPSQASGLIIGRGGACIQMISEMSAAKLQLSAKEDAVFTQERVIHIQGTLAACIKATSQIITKLNEEEEINKYANPSTNYENASFNPMSGGRKERRRVDNGDGGRYNYGSDRVVTISNSPTASPFTETLSATTTINMAVPDMYIGLILGPGGSYVAEITRFTGAKITVSRRGDYIEGTQNRSVSIVGTPQAAQAAHLFIAEKVKHAASEQGL